MILNISHIIACIQWSQIHISVIYKTVHLQFKTVKVQTKDTHDNLKCSMLNCELLNSLLYLLIFLSSLKRVKGVDKT